MYDISISPEDNGFSFGYNKPFEGRVIVSVGNLNFDYI